MLDVYYVVFAITWWYIWNKAVSFHSYEYDFGYSISICSFGYECFIIYNITDVFNMC